MLMPNEHLPDSLEEDDIYISDHGENAKDEDQQDEQQEVVVVARIRNDSLEWIVVAESHLAESDEDVDDDYVGLNFFSEVTRPRYDVLIAHLFLQITFKECFYVCKLRLFCN